MPRKPVFFAQTEGHVLQCFVDTDDGVYILMGDYVHFGIEMSVNSENRYQVSSVSTVPLKLVGVVVAGDLLLRVNNQVVFHEDSATVDAIIKALKQSKKRIELEFLNLRQHSFAAYQAALASRKVVYDELGFANITYVNKVAAPPEHHIAMEKIWFQYMKSIGGPDNLKPVGVFAPSDDLCELVRRGVPIAYRALLWKKLSLSDFERDKYPTNYYEQLLMRGVGEEKEGALDEAVAKQIDNDVDRTFPSHPLFADHGPAEQQLSRVLKAFVVHNPAVGYCQSMNFIAALLLLVMGSEEDAFWLFVTVIERHFPANYFSATMLGSYADQLAFQHAVSRYLPAIDRVLTRHAIQLSHITSSWFLCCFLNVLTPIQALRCWDVFLNEGIHVVFLIGLGLLAMFEKEILAVQEEDDEVFQLLRGLGKRVTSIDALLETSFGVSMTSRVCFTRPGIVLDHNERYATSVDTSQATLKLTKKNLLARVPFELQGIGLSHIGPQKSAHSSLLQLRDVTSREQQQQAMADMRQLSRADSAKMRRERPLSLDVRLSDSRSSTRSRNDGSSDSFDRGTAVVGKRSIWRRVASMFDRSSDADSYRSSSGSNLDETPRVTLQRLKSLQMLDETAVSASPDANAEAADEKDEEGEEQDKHESVVDSTTAVHNPTHLPTTAAASTASSPDYYQSMQKYRHARIQSKRFPHREGDILRWRQQCLAFATDEFAEIERLRASVTTNNESNRDQQST